MEEDDDDENPDATAGTERLETGAGIESRDLEELEGMEKEELEPESEPNAGVNASVDSEMTVERDGPAAAFSCGSMRAESNPQIGPIAFSLSVRDSKGRGEGAVVIGTRFISLLACMLRLTDNNV